MTLAAWAAARQSADSLAAIAHRMVHGGLRYANPDLVTSDMQDDLRRIILFAPQHLTDELACMSGLQQYRPGLPQVACFDTAFHHDLPRAVQIVSVHDAMTCLAFDDNGLHRLSFAFIGDQLPRSRSMVPE